MAEVNFLFFGCWNREILKNNDDDRDPVIPRNQVLNSIKHREGRAKYDCIIIAGDNVYPPPGDNKKTGDGLGGKPKDEKKKKNYSPAVVEEGFRLLADSVKTIKKSNKKEKIDLHMILGNHNTDLLSTEKFSAQNNNIELHAREHDSPIGVHSYRDYGNVRFLFIDTNIDLKDPTNNQKMTGKNTSILKEFLKANLHPDDENWWNIVVGHEPLVSVKTKPNGKQKVTHLLCAEELLKETFAEHHNVVYMCADVHMFQAGQVFIDRARVPMIVSGTGGADPDDAVVMVPSSYHTPDAPQSNLMYQLIDQAAPYGYCAVNVTRKVVKVVYKPIDGTKDEHVIRIKKPKLFIRNKTRRRKSQEGPHPTK